MHSLQNHLPPKKVVCIKHLFGSPHLLAFPTFQGCYEIFLLWEIFSDLKPENLWNQIMSFMDVAQKIHFVLKQLTRFWSIISANFLCVMFFPNSLLRFTSHIHSSNSFLKFTSPLKSIFFGIHFSLLSAEIENIFIHFSLLFQKSISIFSKSIHFRTTTPP